MAPMQWADRIGRRLKLRDLHVLFAVVQSGSMAKPRTSSQSLNPWSPRPSPAWNTRSACGSSTAADAASSRRSTAARSSTMDLPPSTRCGRASRRSRSLADPGAGELRIGCPEWIAAGLLPVITDRLLQRHPRLVFYVNQTITATPEFRELRERRLDLVLGRIAAPFTEDDLHAEILYQEQLRVIAGVRSRVGPASKDRACRIGRTSPGSSPRRTNCRGRW